MTDQVLTIDYSYHEPGGEQKPRTIRLSDNFARLEILDERGRPLLGYGFSAHGATQHAALLLSDAALQVEREEAGEITLGLVAGKLDETVTFESMAAFDRAVALYADSRAQSESPHPLGAHDEKLLLQVNRIHRWGTHFATPIKLNDITAGPQLAQSERFRTWVEKDYGRTAAEGLSSIGGALCDWVDVSRNLCARFEKDDALACGLIRATQMVCDEVAAMRAEEE